MSQAKVDKYKESKKHRKEEVAKQRRKKMIQKVLPPVIVIAVVFWIGFSGVQYYQNHKPAATHEVNFDALDNYMNNIK